MKGMMLNQCTYFPDNSGTGISHLVKVIHNPLPKTLLYYCKDLEKRKVLLLGIKG